MRILHRAGLVFLVENAYFKTPITNALMLCNGKQLHCVRKSDGHYVFVDMQPGEYDVEIICTGYISAKMKVNLRENETQVITVDMSYSIDNPTLYDSAYFDITLNHLGKPVADEEVTVKLNNELDFLQLVEPIAPESNNVKLNVEMLPGILGQNYSYKIKKQNVDMFLNGYDTEQGCYTANETFENDINVGGKFYVFWRVKSDALGRVILPFMAQFITDNNIELEVICGACKGKAQVDLSQVAGNAIPVQPKLRKYTKK